MTDDPNKADRNEADRILGEDGVKPGHAGWTWGCWRRIRSASYQVAADADG